MIPRLVLVSGWPGTGKSTVRKFFENELYFKGVSHDDIIPELWGITVYELEKKPDFTEKLRYAMDEANRRKLEYLAGGHDTVVEATFHRDSQRRRFLDTDGIQAEKYLIVIKVDEEIITQRLLASPTREPYSFDFWRESTQQWPETGYSQDIGCMVMHYPNNTREEEQAMYADLKRRFERSDKIPITTSK